MSDLISRQDATSIPILPKEHRKIFKSIDDAFETGWNEALSCVNMLPSAEPDLSEYSDKLWKNAYERGKAEAQQWTLCSEMLPDYGVSVLTWDGLCYCVEKRIQYIRDEDGEPISSNWWVSDDYDERSDYYPNLRDGACIAWMPLPEPARLEDEYEADPKTN